MRLDADIKTQLRELFKDLDAGVELVIDRSTHPKHGELRAMLEDIGETCARIKLVDAERVADLPTLSIQRDGQATGIQFVGIPGGHEFSSLVLAILNAGGKGRLPDAALAQRIKRLRGGAQVRTYISLSCENCPDVVQALNQIALTHGQLSHVMIDGELAQEELARLKVQGVPSVFIGDQLIHSGRATLAELISKLEDALGTEEGTSSGATVDLGLFDVAVIGGGPAGAAAAIYSVRKGLRTALVATKLGGQMQETKGIENMISIPYTEGVRLSADLDRHLRAYPVEILEHRQVRALKTSEGAPFQVTLDSGEILSASALIIATGAKWRELGVPGEREYIGRGVAFCPHCDGPYYKGKKVAVVGGGNSGVEAAIDLAGICSEVTLFEFMDQLKADEVLIKKLQSLPNVRVVTQAKTTEVVGDGTKVVALRYEDRASGAHHQLDLDGVFVQIGLSPNSDVVKGLAELNAYGEIVVDAKGRTSVPGIYAAGDVTTTPFKQIVIAMGEGAKAALTAFEDRMRINAA